jgi:peptidoglycan/xylan/chitin deacetylase (PgdA/CDA1 family)
MFAYLKEMRIFSIRLLFLAGAFLLVSLTLSFGLGGNETAGAGCGNCQYADYVNKEHTKQLALTFDDVPTGESTREILDVLAEKDVRAGFFVVGQKAVQSPDLVLRMVEESHVIGNHTFDHSRNVHDNKQTFLEQLRRTNKVVETITGRSMVLYRPPYLLDSYKTVRPIGHNEPVWRWTRENGYVAVGADINTNDWNSETPGEAYNNVINSFQSQKINHPDGEKRHMMLLHSEPQTAEALPRIIDELRARGYELVSPLVLLGMTEEEAMPRERVDDQYLSFGFIRFLGTI